MPDTPAPTQHDEETGELLDVYTGDTLEQAMAEAVAALGPDLEVRRARKVRSGVRGLMGRPVYEVLAVPGPAPLDLGGAPRAAAPEQPDRLQDAVARLLAQAEQEEAGRPDQRRPTPVPPAPAAPPAPGSPRATLPPPAPRPAVPSPVHTGVAARPTDAHPAGAPRTDPDADAHPDPSVAEHDRWPLPPRPVTHERVHAEVLPTAATAPAPAAPAPAASAPAASAPAALTQAAPAPAAPAPAVGWSRAALRELGVPAPVLRALPADDPADDLGWLTALTGAIRACVPAPAQPGPEQPVVASGHGLAGAVALLDLGCRGTAPGTLCAGGRTVQASAMELALVVHTSLTGR